MGISLVYIFEHEKGTCYTRGISLFFSKTSLVTVALLYC
jgi:hypothetical protein